LPISFNAKQTEFMIELGQKDAKTALKVGGEKMLEMIK
jgi:hypothetical protein